MALSDEDKAELRALLADAVKAAVRSIREEEWDDERTIDFASAVASCVCLTMPHTLNAPGLEGVLKFIKKHGR